MSRDGHSSKRLPILGDEEEGEEEEKAIRLTIRRFRKKTEGQDMAALIAMFGSHAVVGCCFVEEVIHFNGSPLPTPPCSRQYPFSVCAVQQKTNMSTQLSGFE
jgi:hypothetical protein